MNGTELLDTRNTRVKIIDRGEDGTGLKVGPHIVNTPTGCRLETDNWVKYQEERRWTSQYTFLERLLNISSAACRGCPLLGNTCRYGITA